MNVLKVFSFAAVTVAIALTTACSGKSKPGNAAEELMSSSKEFEKAEATMEKCQFIGRKAYRTGRERYP